jgi:hypothetical protein
MFRPVVIACLGALVSAGCFGDNSESGGNGSPSIDSVVAPATVDAEGGEAEVAVHVRGKAGEQLSVAIAGTLGTFAPEQGQVTADAAGDATFTTRFTAGAAEGEATATINVANLEGARRSKELTLAVRALVRVGEVAQLPNTSGFIASYLDGHTVTVAAAGRLRKLGLVSPDTGDIVIALYADNGGRPGTLITSATGTLRVGVNELPVPEIMLPAGAYWYMMNFRVATDVYRGTATRPVHGFSLPFTNALPATFPTTTVAVTEPVRNCYLVLGQ